MITWPFSISAAKLRRKPFDITLGRLDRHHQLGAGTQGLTRERPDISAAVENHVAFLHAALTIAVDARCLLGE
jgi:hypothetical protein